MDREENFPSSFKKTFAGSLTKHFSSKLSIIFFIQSIKNICHPISLIYFWLTQSLQYIFGSPNLSNIFIFHPISLIYFWFTQSLQYFYFSPNLSNIFLVHPISPIYFWLTQSLQYIFGSPNLSNLFLVHPISPIFSFSPNFSEKKFSHATSPKI